MPPASNPIPARTMVGAIDRRMSPPQSKGVGGLWQTTDRRIVLRAVQLTDEQFAVITRVLQRHRLGHGERAAQQRLRRLGSNRSEKAMVEPMRASFRITPDARCAADIAPLSSRSIPDFSQRESQLCVGTSSADDEGPFNGAFLYREMASRRAPHGWPRPNFHPPRASRHS